MVARIFRKEVVTCSLVPHHDMNHQIAEINNVAPHGADASRSDIESDNVSKDNWEDDNCHQNHTTTWTTLMMFY